MKKTLAIGLIAALALSACGGGGGGSPSTAAAVVPVVVVPPPYNYAALNGRYTCTATGKPIMTLDAVFSAANATVNISAGGINFGSAIYNDKVGMLGGYPYYSENIQLSTNAETLFWYNDQLTVVAGPQSNVPNYLGDNFTYVFYCHKN
jgi:hypothetical protein